MIGQHSGRPERCILVCWIERMQRGWNRELPIARVRTESDGVPGSGCTSRRAGVALPVPLYGKTKTCRNTTLGPARVGACTYPQMHPLQRPCEEHVVLNWQEARHRLVLVISVRGIDLRGSATGRGNSYYHHYQRANHNTRVCPLGTTRKSTRLA